MSQAPQFTRLVETLAAAKSKQWRKQDGGLFHSLVELCRTMCEMQYPWLHNVDGMTLHDIYEELRKVRSVYDVESLRTIDLIYFMWSEWDVQQREMYYAARLSKRGPGFFDIDDSQYNPDAFTESSQDSDGKNEDVATEKGKERVKDVDHSTKIVLPDHTKWNEKGAPVRIADLDEVEGAVSEMANLMMAAGNPYDNPNILP